MFCVLLFLYKEYHTLKGGFSMLHTICVLATFAGAEHNRLLRRRFNAETLTTIVI